MIHTRILVIDDEEAYCEVIRYNLLKEGYQVDVAYSAEEALTKNLPDYNLLIVDIMMDKMSGYDFLMHLRTTPATEHIPVIFCSALNSEDDKVMGLNIGADDFITKPFTVGEVVARVRAVLRRANNRQTPGAPTAHHQTPIQEHSVMQPATLHTTTYEPDIIYKNLRLDRNEKNCYINGELVPLTRKEYDMLIFFLQNRERIHSREEIMHQVWGSQEVTNRAVDTNITRLRQKLGPYGDNIVTRLGYGYGFKSEV